MGFLVYVQVLTVAVLAIVLCAPSGAILGSVLGPWLLKHSVEGQCVFVCTLDVD